MKPLRCEHVRMRFGGLCVLEDVTLHIASSGVTAIVGPNGAGKTTLLNVITGYVRPSAGRCYYGSEDITTYTPRRIAKLGVIRTFQELRLIRRLSCLANVTLAQPAEGDESPWHGLLRSAHRSGETRRAKTAQSTLARLGLCGVEETLACELSYGQQRLLTLACCLSAEPELLLLDEPVAGLHPDLTNSISAILKETADSGIGVVFIEHDLAFVRDLANWVIVLDKGGVVAEGEPGDVLSRSNIIEAYIG